MKKYYSRMSQQERKETRERMVVEQGHKCWYCEQPLSGKPPKHIAEYPINLRMFPAGMLVYPIHLHHDHKTDECLGAVHAKCNAYMWQKYRQ